jgi:outer membrane protein assembly factor BamB
MGQVRRSHRRGLAGAGRARATAPAWALALSAGLAGVLGPVELARLSGAGFPAALAQPAEPENPVFVADSPAAADALLRVQEFLASDNLDQAARVLQRLLDEDPGALVADPADPALYVGVRARVHAVLLGKSGLEGGGGGGGALLEAYRRAQQPRAEDLLAQGRHAEVRDRRLLTPAGLEAALRVAGDQFEAADFAAALRTLLELDTHPDLREPGEALTRATQLARLLARYTTDARAAALAQGWSARGGGGQGAATGTGDVGVIAGPPRPERRSALSPQPAVGTTPLDGLVPQPLSLATFGRGEPIEPPRLPPGVSSPEQLPRTGRELRIMPELSGQTLYVPGARSIVALDRVTLEERWRAEVPALLGLDAAALDQTAAERSGPARAGSFAWEDIRAVAVREPFVVAVASVDGAANVGADGEALVALDSRTGATRWAVSPREMGADLDRARVRGPLHLVGDTLVAGLRKELRDRRLLAVSMVGLNLQDGTPRWTRLLASAGLPPFFRVTTVADGSVVDAGVIYRVDRLGVVAAVDAATGWPVWVRRLSPEPFELPEPSSPWQISLPIVHGDAVTILSPDRRSIITLDRERGSVRSSVPAEAYDQPAYLLAAGDRLVGIGAQRIVVGALADPGGSRASTPRVPDPGIRGRVVVSGDRLIVPLVSSAWVVDPNQPSSPRTVALDHTGTFITIDDLLLAVDDARAYAYLPWPSADRLLTERIETSSDASAAVALAELAYRAGQPGRIDYAVRSARRLIAAAADTARASRDRLVDVLARMISAGLLDRSGTRVASAESAAMPSASPPGSDLGDELRGTLLGHLGELAQSPGERGTHLLLLGRHHERGGRTGAALEAYQRVLAEQAVADAAWEGEPMTQRAGVDASRRVLTLVAAGPAGRQAYAPFDAEAARAAAALTDAADPPTIEGLVRQYPAALVAPGLWMKLGLLHERESRPRAAARAFELGLRSAEGDTSADRAVLAELAGRLLENLRTRGLLSATDELARALPARFPGLSPTRAGQPLDLAALSAELSRLLAQSRRWPRVGPPTSVSQVLAGWAIMEPAIKPSIPAAVNGLVLRHEDGRVACFAPPANAPDAALEPIWSSPPNNDPAELVRSDRGSALLFFATAEGGVLERVDTTAGQSAWRSEPFPKLFRAAAGEAPESPAERIRTPLDGLRLTSELLVCVDEQTVALVERTGRLAAFDADAGSVLWTARLPLSRVFDCDVAGDLLAVAGERDEPGAPNGLVAPKAMLLILDARTGREVTSFTLDGGPVRWLRLTSRGEVLAGLEASVVGLDPESGAVAWRNDQPAAVETLRCWVKGGGSGTALLLGRDRSLWRLSVATGTLDARPIDVAGRFDTNGEPALLPLDDDRAAIVSPQGVAVIGIDGRLLGADALGGGDTLLPAHAGEGVLVTIETGSSSREAGPPVSNLHLLDARSARLIATAPLVLGDTPLRMALLDARVAVTAGHTTVLYRAEPRQ